MTDMTNNPLFALAASMAAQAQAGQGAKPAQADLPEEIVWANLGIEVPMPNLETGMIEPFFLALSRGIPVTTMKPVEVDQRAAKTPGQLRFQQRQQAQNALQKILADEGLALQPGETKVIAKDPVTGWCVQLQRVKGKTEVAALPGADNPFATALAALSKG